MFETFYNELKSLFLEEQEDGISRYRPWKFFREEWMYWMGGGIFSVFLSSVLLFGREGLILNFRRPISYLFDSQSHAWMIQRVIEGWVYENPRNGYPFGSAFYDYPNSDFANLFFMKLLGYMFNNWVGVFNFYVFFGFFAIFASSYIVLRSLSFWKSISISGSIVFTFLSFHILRIPHLFYTFYFVVPIFFMIALIIGQNGKLFWPVRKYKIRFVLVLTGLTLLSSFGVYYALFGIITVMTGAVGGSIYFKSYRPVIQGTFVALLVCIGVGLNVLPNKIYTWKHGSNPLVAVRLPVDAEMYSLKLRQLIFPRVDHRNHSMSWMTMKYTEGAPKSYYEWSSTLGVIGAIGFIFSGVILFSMAFGKGFRFETRSISVTTWILFLFGTMGGLGAVFAGIISSSIRGWDRIVVFIAFGAITIFFIPLQNLLSNFSNKKYFKAVLVSTILASLIFAVYDQNISSSHLIHSRANDSYEIDRDFIMKMEKELPVGAAIYQLPYIDFPEQAGLHRMPGSYEMLKGFLNSEKLKWSFGGMAGRTGDMFFRSLRTETVDDQVDIIRKAGFSGIYIDKRGYKDDAKELVAKLEAKLGYPPTLIREDGEIIVFKLTPEENIDFDGITPEEIVKKIGYTIKSGKL